MSTRMPEPKLLELILYISDRSEFDPYYGVTKLNKILFFSDISFYAKHERGITEQKYIKRDFGPVPRDIQTATTHLLEQSALVIKERDCEGMIQKRPIAIREADLTAFSGEEIAMVDRVIDKLRGKSATETSELSHTMTGWEIAQFGEEIPLHTVFIERREATSRDQEWAKRLTPHA
jgi:hypothetical protein